MTSEVVVVDSIAMATGMGGLGSRLERLGARGSDGTDCSGKETVTEAPAIELELILESQKFSNIW